jgi:hypothetical protein
MAFKTDFSVLLAALLVCSLALCCFSTAQADLIPKPSGLSRPQFTIYLEGPTFLRNTTYALNSDTGQIQADLGYTNPYSAIVLQIKNQQFDSSQGELYYNVKATANGSQVYLCQNDGEGRNTNTQWTDSDYTNYTVPIEYYHIAGAQVEFQVQAMLGSYGYSRNMDSPLPLLGCGFYGEISDWSAAQTVTVPANVPLTPTPAPQVSTDPSGAAEAPLMSLNQSGSFVVLAVGLGAVIVLLVVVVVFLRRKVRVLERKLSE